jgi:hypothetical protein
MGPGSSPGEVRGVGRELGYAEDRSIGSSGEWWEAVVEGTQGGPWLREAGQADGR